MAPLAFLGSPAVAAGTLEALLAAGHEVGLVVTNPDRRRARRTAAEPNPVKQVALANRIEVAEHPGALVGRGFSRGIVVAYGRLIRSEVLGALPLVNVHFSLLPRWRGAAPVERAILAGDTETGVCLMALEETLDTGPVFARRATPIGPDEDAGALRSRLGAIGTELLLAELARGEQGFADPVPQAGEANYADKITVSDRHLDFTEPAELAHRRVRVGRAWTTFRGRRVIVHAAAPVSGAPPGAPGELVGDLVATPDGALRLVTVQAEGRAVMGLSTFLAGVRPQPGERLGP